MAATVAWIGVVSGFRLALPGLAPVRLAGMTSLFGHPGSPRSGLSGIQEKHWT